MKTFLSKPLMLCLALACPLAVAEIYKTEDESGNAVFSDQASEQAEEVEVGEGTVFESRQFVDPYRGALGNKEQNDEDAEDDFQYARLSVSLEGGEDTIRANSGDISVVVTIEPGKQQGHVIELLMDGEVNRTLSQSTTLAFTNVDRGTHQFQLRVKDSEGNELQSGPVSPITVLRYSKPRS